MKEELKEQILKYLKTQMNSNNIEINLNSFKITTLGDEKCNDCNGNGIYLEQTRTYCNNKGDKCWTCEGSCKETIVLNFQTMR